MKWPYLKTYISSHQVKLPGQTVASTLLRLSSFSTQRRFKLFSSCKISRIGNMRFLKHEYIAPHTQKAKWFSLIIQQLPKAWVQTFILSCQILAKMNSHRRNDSQVVKRMVIKIWLFTRMTSSIAAHLLIVLSSQRTHLPHQWTHQTSSFPVFRLLSVFLVSVKPISICLVLPEFTQMPSQDQSSRFQDHCIICLHSSQLLTTTLPRPFHHWRTRSFRPAHVIPTCLLVFILQKLLSHQIVLSRLLFTQSFVLETHLRLREPWFLLFRPVSRRIN